MPSEFMNTVSLAAGGRTCAGDGRSAVAAVGAQLRQAQSSQGASLRAFKIQVRHVQIFETSNAEPAHREGFLYIVMLEVTGSC